MALSLAILACAACLSWSAVAQASFQEQCLSFKPETYVYNSTREVLEFVPAGTNLSFPDNDPSCARPNQVVSVDLCRVALSIPTSNRSSFTYEHWLPQSWTGRFLSTGNGGIDGCQLSPRNAVRPAMINGLIHSYRHQVRGHRIRHAIWVLCDRNQ